MYTIVLIGSLVACAYGAVILPAVPKPDQRIVGGNEIDISQAPFVVSVQRSTTKAWDHLCGGTIISQRFILTAAHCTDEFLSNPSNLRIHAGSSYHSSDGTPIVVNGIKQHERFNTHRDFDIAILHLIKDLPFSSIINSIRYPSQNLPLADDVPVTIYGWGSVASGKPFHPLLQKVVIQTINHEECSGDYSDHENKVTANMICAGIPEKGGKGPCDGDFGGPLVSSNLVYGISSWSKDCAEPNRPGVFTKVSMFSEWILTNMVPPASK